VRVEAERHRHAAAQRALADELQAAHCFASRT
jgi:hypothetical protein